MSHFRPMDPAFPIDRQLGLEASPVVLINLFTLDKVDEPKFLEVWQDDAAFMKRQPGFISTQCTVVPIGMLRSGSVLPSLIGASVPAISCMPIWMPLGAMM